MLFFDRFLKRKQLNTPMIDPVIMDGFLNKIEDIVCIANYDFSIELINKPEINEKYTTLKELLSAERNQDVYETITKKVLDEGYFIGDIEIEKDNGTVRLYVAAYNVISVKKIFFYIKDTNKYFKKTMELLNEIDKQGQILKSKDLFIANVSHEIKTPINIIVGMVYFLKETKLDEQQLEYVKKLDEASEFLLSMTNDILSLSSKSNMLTKVEDVQSEFELGRMVKETLELFKQKVEEKDLKLYYNIDIGENTNVKADKSRINQVIASLIANAIKYTDKGFIEVNVKKVEESKLNYKFQFCVQDTGIGIKKEDTLKIFREFSQVEDPTRKVKDGKGMGLAIAKKIVEDMNGKMWVESSVGLGSKFYFTIILEKSNKTTEELKEQHNAIIKEAIANSKTTDVNEEESTSKKILLVEDNEMNIEITKQTIEKMEYTCDVAKDGVQAIRQIKENGVDFYDLILMDIHLPKYNGYDISKILKEDINSKTPIVALTATVITDEIKQENEKYILDYIQKPIRPDELQNRIRGYFTKKTVEIDNGPKEKILILCENEDRREELREQFKYGFEVAVTNNENEMKIILEADKNSILIIDEMENLDKEIEIINSLKFNKEFENLIILLLEKKENSKLNEKKSYINVDGIIEAYDADRYCSKAKSIIEKIRKEENLEKELEQTKDDMKDVYNFLFDSMVNLTTSKSKETGEHLRRTRKYMNVMLKKYEEFYKENLFTDKEIIEDISMAAILHDIGKVGIPDNILNKPDKLNEEEYEIIKSHVTIGKNILETTYSNKVSNNILEYAKDIVYHHHEKFDGTGYPEHLKGDEISVISRIMGLIDVYDALANPRVYKKALTYNEVEEYIENQAGKAFDPKIINIFKMVKDELKRINEENKDVE